MLDVSAHIECFPMWRGYRVDLSYSNFAHEMLMLQPHHPHITIHVDQSVK
jgi:hypothetical protein